ncbi:MAG: DUF4175 family protein [Bacteroidota bacterium]|nr:DUF4175 family protein [Bacteroidota bacterium]
MNNVIIEKLNAFIRSYYKNLVVRGGIYTLLLLILFFIVLALVEYFGWQSQSVRTAIFYTYFTIAIVVLFIWVVVPLAKIFFIGKTISYKQAAQIIGQYFPEIKDKLLNLLELQELSQENSLSIDNSLLLAAIEQKTNSLSKIPFYKAINKTKTKKYAKILIGVCCMFAILFLCFPKLFSEPTLRYINHNVFYEKPAPFSFIFDPNIRAIQHNDVEIKVKVEGEILPDKVNILINGQSLEMKKKDKTHFLYTIAQIQKTTLVQFEAVGVRSKIYTINVNPKPILTDLSAEVIYPQYTGQEKEIINNVTDISVPEGTQINWLIRSKDAEQVLFKSNDITNKLEVRKNFTTHRVKYLSSQNISIKMQNSKTLSMDSLAFFVNVIRDEKPQIAVIEEKENDLSDKIYFRGQIKDDYGFSRLEFCLKKTSPTGNVSDYKQTLPITLKENAQEFYYFLDLEEYKINAGDKIEYYFEVWDNDQIHGAKSTKSQSFNISIPDSKEVEQIIKNNTQDISKQSDEALKELKNLQKKINELTKRLTENKELTWKDRQELEDLKNRQEKIKQNIKNIQEKISESSSLEEKYRNMDESLLEKQRQIEELFKELENKELKELIKQIEELAKQNLSKEKMNESFRQLQEKNEELSKQLDKNLELYKRLDVEKNINDAINKLKELSENQKELSKETSKKDANKETLTQKQDSINKEFRDLQKKMEEIEKKDASLEEPFKFKREEEKENSITQDLQQAKENINKNKKEKASQSQKQASEKMQQMAEQMEQNMEESEQEQLSEDIDNIRQILKNLVTLSKQEEALIYSSQNTKIDDPAYQNIINKQNSIKESMKDISDSLYNLSKRQPHVSNTIHEQTYKVMENINSSLDKLLKYNQSFYNALTNNQAASSQQYAMTSMNNLALLLAESLDNMNQQQSQAQKSKGASSQQCKNPSSSGGKKSIKNMKQMQEALNKEIKRLQKELEKQGNKPHKIGEGRQLNEELAKAAAQQEMIRKMMEEYLQEMKEEEGKAIGNINKALKNMEETEKDIVNKRINANTVKRQNEILTRMLESERAEKKREKDNERKSNTGVDRKQEEKESFEAFKKLKNRDMELFKEIPPVYSSYYKTKINEYFYNL